MAALSAFLAVAVTLAGLHHASAVPSAGSAGAERESSLLQTWGRTLDGAAAKETPVTRVVALLNEMSATLKKEQDEDEALYKQLGCWCHNNNYEKDNAMKEAEAKIAELTSTIEELTSRSAGLETNIKELDTEVAENKKALGEATALREKQAKEFHGAETDNVQAIENLKAALTVLAKHQGNEPKSSVAGGPVFKTEQDQWSLLGLDSKDAPWSEEHEAARSARSLDDFMRRNNFDRGSDASMSLMSDRPQKFLHQENTRPSAAGWSADETLLVRRALKSASAFVQARHGGAYYPAYSSQSGEIVGILKELKEEMEGDLAESQKIEQARAAAFEELRAAKTAEIENGERMAEQKEDELATTKNNLAEAKEDLEQTQAALSEDQKFMMNLKTTCDEAATNFEARKTARLQEIEAVSQTIEILTADDARDAMAGTYSFLQTSAEDRRKRQERQRASQVLRQTAKALKDPMLSVLATRVELDAFTKVKKAIDDMIAMLKVQQEDEVKKSDYCKAEIQENEMTTAKQTDHKAGLEAKADKLASDIKTLVDRIAAAQAEIAQLELELQRASEARQAENLDFQKTVADQTATQEVLKVALDRLATYYDKEFLLQQASHSNANANSKRQTPPVPQMEYKPSQGASGVMQMIEKLIQEAKGLIADSVKSESDAQAAYEQTVADTNDSVATLQEEISTKTAEKAAADKDKLETESDIVDTQTELDGLAKYNTELHAECDYVLKNFMVRQEAREQEIEALQQAKQILSGASLG